ncbi:Ig-like domain-containing protein [Peptoniphilus harei]|nr:Ig-like domain-containing protein [Peptoniphilus harei]QQE46503.1 MucBP domain-containing protein [Peptoniphilus harei]
MEKLREFIEKKKEKSASRRPRYGTRKLSVGLVSCVLGYCIFFSPTVVSAAVEDGSETASIRVEASADTSDSDSESESDETKAVETPSAATNEVESPQAKASVSEVADEAPAVAETPVAEAEKEAPAEEVVEAEKEEPAISEEKSEPVVEENAETKEVFKKEEIEALKANKEANIEETVAADKKENKTEETTPKAEENKDILESEDDKEAIVEDKKVANKEELQISEEPDPKALQAGETESKDISNSIINPVVKLNTDKTEEEGKLMAGDGEALGYEVSFTTPKDTKSGDTFTLKLSENMSLKGIEPDTEEAVDIKIDGKVIAKGKRINRQTIVYTFTDEINDLRRVKLSLKGFAFDNKDLIRDSKDQDFSINVGKNSYTKKLYVDYGKNYYTGRNLNGSSQFTSFDPKTGDFTQVFYVNPDSKHIGVYSGKPSPNRISMIIDPSDDRGNKSDLIYTKENTSVFVQKLDEGADVPDAIFEHPTDDLDETMVKTIFLPEGIEIVFADQKDDKLANEVNSPYIVTVKSHIDIKDIDNFNLTSKGILYGDVMGKHTMFNQIKVAKGDADAEGEKLGYFKEHHKYYDKVDGKLRENPTFIIDSSTDEGIAEETYTTSKNEIGSYKFIRIDEDALVENPVYNENGEKATGNFEEEKTKEVTYIYVREVTSGSFQEHHIYQTVDEDDNVISTDDTVNKDETRGIDEDSYKTSKIDRDGYTLTEVRATNDESAELGVKFDSKGAETTGNYVNGKKLEVTYIYQKEEQQPVEKKGSFQEHHIYQTKKLDGTIVEDSRDDKEVKEGTEKENYKTSKQDKEGYTLTKIESTNGGQFNEDGSLKEAAYIADKKQEVTYIYQKEEQQPVEKKGSFQEHHIYQTKKLDGTIVEDSRDDKEVKEGTEKENYKTSKQDKEGYTLTKIESTNGGQFNEDGSLKEAAYIADKKQEVTYIYQKEEQQPVEKKGSFQEHHIYQTKKLDGTIVEDSRDDKEVKEGTEKENYKTSKQDKEGYTLTKIESTNGGQFNEDGSLKEAAYIADKKQEVTYIYQKEEQQPVEKKGSFQEHHIYQTKKLDGTIVEDSRDDKEVKEGTEKENYKTSKQDKEGYTLTKIESTNGGQFNEDGSLKEAAYIADKKQEVTYIYQKEEQQPVEKKGSFQEHHIYQTKKLDGTIVEDSRDDKEVKEGTEKENYKTSKQDKEGYTLTK